MSDKPTFSRSLFPGICRGLERMVTATKGAVQGMEVIAAAAAMMMTVLEAPEVEEVEEVEVDEVDGAGEEVAVAGALRM